MARKSGRVRASKAVYTDDPFAVAGISDDEPDEKPSKKTKRPKRESPSDDEFVGGNEDEDEDVDDVDDDEMEDTAVSEERKEKETEGDLVDFPEAIDNDFDSSTIISKKRPVASSVRPRARGPDGSIEVDPNESHYRGGLNHNNNTSKEMLYKFALGSDERDLYAAIYQRDQWLGSRDACFPRRSTLEDSEKLIDYPYGPTFGLNHEDFRKEETSAWDWYYKGDIANRFQTAQRLEKMKKTDINDYLVKLPTKKHTVLMGPAGQQTKIDLGYYEPYDYVKAWDAHEDEKDDQSPKKPAREGWLMSLGGRIQCLAWAPNQDGLSQYLALVVPISQAQKQKYGSLDSEPQNSFQPTVSYPCALQLWRFESKESHSSTRPLEMKTKPQRRLVACMKWGDLRSMAWCPVPRAERSGDSQDETESIGLLAGIWGDGKVRVLDIKLSRGLRGEEYGMSLIFLSCCKQKVIRLN